MDLYNISNISASSVATENNNDDEYDAFNNPLSRITTSLATLDPDVALDNFNSVEYLINTLERALNSLQYDKALVLQSQMAGEANNASFEVLKTIEELEKCILEHSAKYQILKLKIIPEIKANLKQSAATVTKLTSYMKKNHPVEYSKGRDKVLNRITDDEEDTGLFQ